MTPSLNQKFTEFFEVHSPQRLCQNLRRMLLDYLSHELKNGIPNSVHDLLWQCYDLFDLLDYATKHTSLNEEQHEQEMAPPKITEPLNTNIKEFFRTWDFPGFEKNLFEMLRRSLTNEGDESSATECSDTFIIYESTLQLVKACHAHHQHHNQFMDQNG